MFNSRTRLIIVNTPNNPVGKVFARDELEHIANLCQKHNVICISDEVYEWLVYDENKKHIRIATLSNTWQRTLTIGSAGKTFSSAGLKLEVVARCFEYELKRINSSECYFNSISNEFLKKCDKLVQALKECGMKSVIPDGGYFILVDYSQFASGEFQLDADEVKDIKFVRYLIEEKQLATILVTDCYITDHRHLAENYIRFCFAKKDQTLDKVIEILRKLKTN
ncbi:unnamed protein product [Rotaria sordida]|uniref:kynurenine--oxoglutarate transaminase n=1 Tax=Rotaria sordida TaxID=392033 RepID=A0A818SLM8_9BILA|nr:unnamed protein product [Rotaria sordida]CAF1232085.1 unnamed protein product [Rotaria sordida]CAF1233373.1 unnamed protein product [Rotaria sordida]CAF1286384.1 unnamed protein product [Rotaria sordida]CAF1498927.1 unnamed protein product [Rotaria sordida]